MQHAVFHTIVFLAFSCFAFSTLAIWCRKFMSRIFHPCNPVPHFHVSHFPPLQHGAAFSCPAVSCLAFSASPTLLQFSIDFPTEYWFTWKIAVNKPLYAGYTPGRSALQTGVKLTEEKLESCSFKLVHNRCHSKQHRIVQHLKTNHYWDQRTHAHLTAISGTTQVSRYQKGKTNLDFTEARDSEWRWHQLGHMQVCT